MAQKGRIKTLTKGHSKLTNSSKPFEEKSTRKYPTLITCELQSQLQLKLQLQGQGGNRPVASQGLTQSRKS